MHEVLVNCLGGLSQPRKSVVRLTDRPDMTLDVYRGCKTTMQQQQQITFRTACNLHECCITAEQCHKKEVIKNWRKDNLILQLLD